MSNCKFMISLVSNAIFAIDAFLETGNSTNLEIALQLLRAALAEGSPTEVDAAPALPDGDPEAELRIWIRLHYRNFNYYVEDNDRYGAVDNNYIYIINRYFQRFCSERGYNSLTLLKQLKRNGALKMREKADLRSHNGYYKSKRIDGKVESCVWLTNIKPEENHA